MKKKSGSVVIFTLMILSVIVILTEQLIKGVFVGSQFTKTMVYREHAEMLALGGVTLAIAQLTVTPEDHENKAEEKVEPSEEKSEKTGKNKKIKKFLSNVIPHLNRWQEFTLKQSIDGIDGVVKICVTCENGKININEAFDFKKQEFKKDIQELLKRLEIPNMLPAGEISTRFTEFFKKRNRKLDDITELSEIPGISKLNLFYSPPEKPLEKYIDKARDRLASKKKKSEPNKDITLQDLFTTWTDDETVNPLWFSDAMCAVFSLRRPQADDAKRRQENFKQFLGMFKEQMVQDWDANWKTLEPLYEEKPKVLPEIKKIFSKEFWPKVFSVLSYGKVGHVEQTVLAVIKEVENASELDHKDDQEDEKDIEKKGEARSSEDKDKKSSESKKIFKIMKIYWI